MKTVLLAWELGANLGHAGPLLLIARALKRQGHRPIFVLRDVVGPRLALAAEDIDIFQAPVWPESDFLRGRPFRIASYADNLAMFGFAEPEGLAAMVRAWDDLLALIKPDLVICDHSPTLCLAAFGTIPVAIVGNGYTVPPVHEPRFPALYAQQPVLVAETRILESVAKVQRQRGRSVPATLPALFDAPLRVIATFPELDPYRASRREPVIGPLETMPADSPRPATPQVFAYLGHEHPSVATIVECLIELNCAVEIYLRGEVGALRGVLAARGARVHAKPPPLSEVVPRCWIVVSHGGSTTAHAALAGGRPQLVLPTHVEQELTAEALVAMEVGAVVERGAKKPEIMTALQDVLESSAMRYAAHARAARIAARPLLDALALVTDACLKLLA
jgi:UDP:flavonoid glycosyltransferase YjiC (YdhE family)